MHKRTTILAAAVGALLMAAVSGTARADQLFDPGYRSAARSVHAAGVRYHVPVRRVSHHVVRRHASAGHYRYPRRAQHYRYAYRAPYRYAHYRDGRYHRHYRRDRGVDVGAVLAGAVLGRIIYEALDDDREPVRYRYRR